MKKISAFLLSVILALCLVGILAPNEVKADEVLDLGELKVHFLDVGQGDSCIVELPDDRTMLIDAGERGNCDNIDDYITENIKDGDGNKITYFDIVIMTHSDSDHIGSMAEVLDLYPAKVVYRPNQQCTYKGCTDHADEGENERNRFWGERHGEKGNAAAYHNAIESAYRNSDEVIVTNPHDDTQNVISSTSSEQYEIGFFAPISSFYGTKSAENNNNYSPIIVISYKGRRIVVSGDAEKENEAEFVEAARQGEGRYAIFDDSFCADVIKLGHHGSSTSSTEEYLDTVTKAAKRGSVFVIISCAKINKYNHPSAQTMARLADMGFSDQNILYTYNGDVVLSVKSVDGEYKTVYNDRTGGEANSGKVEGGGSAAGQVEQTEPDIISVLIAKFSALSLPMKIVAVIIVIALIVLVLSIAYKIITNQRKKPTKRRRKR